MLEEGFPEAYREVVNVLVPVLQHLVLGAGTCSVLQDRDCWWRGKRMSGRSVLYSVHNTWCSSGHNDGVNNTTEHDYNALFFSFFHLRNNTFSIHFNYCWWSLRCTFQLIFLWYIKHLYSKYILKINFSLPR